MGEYVGFAGTLPSVSTKMQRVTGKCEVSSTECAGQSISVDVVPDDRMVLSSARSRANIGTPHDALLP